MFTIFPSFHLKVEIDLFSAKLKMKYLILTNLETGPYTGGGKNKVTGEDVAIRTR
jgi:hypothetical protein